MATLDALARLVAADKGLATVTALRPNGSVQATVVNVGVLPHPVSGEPVAGFVAYGAARKLGYWRANAAATVTVRVGWEWVTVEGAVDLIGPDDALAGFDPAGLPQLLRDVFSSAGGNHDDWDEYDRVMVEQRRAAVLVQPRRVYSNPG
jgi:PPOX class probable F420-dependent enzyme